MYHAKTLQTDYEVTGHIEDYSHMVPVYGEQLQEGLRSEKYTLMHEPSSILDLQPQDILGFVRDDVDDERIKILKK